MTSASIDVSETCNGLAERAAVLHYYTETAATVLGGVLPNGLQQGEKHDPALVGALVLAQAVMESADACAARLERIADTLDDLVEAIDAELRNDYRLQARICRVLRLLTSKHSGRPCSNRCRNDDA